MQKKGTSWGWIIFWLVIFWPIGLFLVIRKLATDKSALMSGKTSTLSIVAWILIVIGGLGFIGLVSDPSDDVGSGIIVALVMIAGGIMLLRKTSNTKVLAAKYKRYIDLIVNHNVRSIDDIASAVGVSYEVASKELQDMINSGYLKDANIHQGNRQIMLKESNPMAYEQVSPDGQVYGQVKVVRCKGCGANNVVTVGQVTECEYCGTPNCV